MGVALRYPAAENSFRGISRSLLIRDAAIEERLTE